MRSKNADFLKEAMFDMARRRQPLERLDQFVEHSKRMRSLRDLGELRRLASTEPKRHHDA